LSIKHLLLGALNENSDYGYNLKNHFFSKLLSDFGFNDGQIYPTLKKLESDGFITKEIVYNDSGPNRHKYHITKEGKQLFYQWLENSDDEDKAYRYESIRKDPFLNKCLYLSFLEKEKAISKINNQIKIVKNSIDDFNNAHKKMTEHGINPMKIKILEYSIKNQETKLEWLLTLLDEIK